MKFRRFFEVDWHQHIPIDKLAYNESAVSDFVSRMADNNKNSYAVFLNLDRQSSQFDINQVRYNGRISNNLLKAEDIRLGRARGIVTGFYKIVKGENAEKSPVFRFYVKGPRMGNLDIIHPPVIYDDTDKELLRAIIIHELRHAQDFVSGREVDAVSYRFDSEAYMKSISEARAWADQLRELHGRMGDSKKVIRALSQEPKWVGVPNSQFTQAKKSPFRLPGELLQASQDFLKHFEVKESVASWMAAPLTAASLMLSPQMQPKISQPVVAQAVEKHKEEAQELVEKIFSKMFFKNFVIKP
jgi:hypothetical protein